MQDALDSPRSAARSDPEAPVHHGPVLACAFLGSETFFATGSVEGDIVIWDLAAECPVRRIGAHRGPVRATLWRDGLGRLISAGQDRRICLSDPRAGAVTASLEGHEAGVFALATSADGALLASGGYDQAIRLWSLPGGRSLGVLGRHASAVTALVWPATPNLLISAGRDHALMAWDIETRRLRWRSVGHEAWVSRLCAAPDGGLVYSVSEDSSVRAWDSATGKAVWRWDLGGGRPIWGLERTNDGDALIIGAAGGVLRLDIGAAGVAGVRPLAVEGAGLWRAQAAHRALSRSPAGLIAQGADSGDVYLYDPAAHDAPMRRLSGNAPGSLALAALRLQPARPTSIAAVITNADGSVGLELKGRRRKLNPPHATFAYAACRLGSTHFATAGFDGLIQIWRAHDGGHVFSLDHSGLIFSLSADSDGSRLVSAGHDRVRLWDVQNGALLWGAQDLGAGVHCVAALAPSGQAIVCVGETARLHRWTSTEKGFGAPQAIDIDCADLTGVVLGDDARHAIVSTADGDVRRLDLNSGASIRLHAVHEDWVRSLQASPDGRFVLSVSQNSIATVWDLEGVALATPPALADAAAPAAGFSQAGDLVWVDGRGGLHVTPLTAISGESPARAIPARRAGSVPARAGRRGARRARR